MCIIKTLRDRLEEESGFTLVEALVSITILAVGAFTVAQTLIFGLSTSGLSRQKLAARSAVDQQMEQARALNYENLVLSDTTALTHSTDPTSPDYWVDQSAQTFDPDGTGPLAAEPLVRVAGASPSLVHYQNPLVNGSTTYSAYRYVTWVDSPTDGCVVATTSCPTTPDATDGNHDGISDANGQDEKRVVVEVTWNDQLGRGTTSMSQSSLFADGKIVYQQPVKNTAPTMSCPTVSTLPYQFLQNGGYLTFASQASDPDGSIASTTWTITKSDGSIYNDGTTSWNSVVATNPTVKFPFNDATYGVVNTVTDNGGSQTSNANLNCTVQTPDLAGNGGPDGTLAINGDATYTPSTIVTLDLSKIKSGTPTQEQVSNDGLTWGAKQAYNASTSWTLTAGDGVKWVYVRFYDSTGKYGPAAYASITLDTGPPGAPTSLTLSSSSTNGNNKTVTLGWTAPTGVTDLGSYRLYSRLITSTGAYGLVCTTASTSCSTTYKKTDSYQFYVVAYDLAGNVSAQSNSITA